VFPDVGKLTEIIGTKRRGSIAGHELDVIALPHPSGASTWHRTEPGKSLLARALELIGKHEAWRGIATAAKQDASDRARTPLAQ
jgi:uracil-DNA glycosylase